MSRAYGEGRLGSTGTAQSQGSRAAQSISCTGSACCAGSGPGLVQAEEAEVGAKYQSCISARSAAASEELLMYCCASRSRLPGESRNPASGSRRSAPASEACCGAARWFDAERPPEGFLLPAEAARRSAWPIP